MISAASFVASSEGVTALVAAAFVLGALLGLAVGVLSVCRPLPEPPDDFRGENL